MIYKEEKLTPFMVDDLEYNVGIQIYDNTVVNIYFEVTTRSGRKKRDKKLSKDDNHFLSLGDTNSLKVFAKLSKIIKPYLQKYDFVLLSGYADQDEERRIILYRHYFNKLGFTEESKKFRCNTSFMYRPTSLKKKRLYGLFEEIVDFRDSWIR